MPLKLYPDHQHSHGVPHPVTWVLVADARMARIYTRSRHHPLLVPVGERDYAFSEIAGILEQAWECRSFERLVLIAVPKMLGDLRRHLSEDVRDTVVAEISRGLAHAPLQALSLYLAENDLL